MKKNKTSISNANSYKDIGAYWDDHDLSEVWSNTKKVQFDVKIESETTYYALEKSLSDKVQFIARKQGVSSDTLLNLWIQEKLHEFPS